MKTKPRPSSDPVLSTALAGRMLPPAALVARILPAMHSIQLMQQALMHMASKVLMDHVAWHTHIVQNAT